MNKIVLAAALVGAVGLACAEDVPSVTTNNSIITFYVPEAQTLTYDGSLTYPAVKGFEKTGGGTLVMTTAATSFDNKNANQYIREGILEEQVKGAVGAYNNLYISDGAQLYLNFESGNQSDYSPIPTYIKGIAGSGPDGTGAIRIGDKVTSNWSSFIRNEFTLTGDTTIQCDNKTMTGFSTSSTLNLRGHTLTFNGKANLWFGRNATNGSGPIVDPGAGGGIVNNMTNNTYFYNLTTFKGDATSTFEITAGSILYLNSLANPFPWKLKNSQKKL